MARIISNIDNKIFKILSPIFSKNFITIVSDIFVLQLYGKIKPNLIITSANMTDVVETNTVPLGEGMFYLQLTPALDTDNTVKVTKRLISMPLLWWDQHCEIEVGR